MWGHVSSLGFPIDAKIKIFKPVSLGKAHGFRFEEVDAPWLVQLVTARILALHRLLSVGLRPAVLVGGSVKVGGLPRVGSSAGLDTTITTFPGVVLGV